MRIGVGSSYSINFINDKKTTVACKRLVKIAKLKEPHYTPLKFIWGAILLILTTTIKVNMGRRLPNKIIYRIRIYIKAN
jgi:hypothetical protein